MSALRLPDSLPDRRGKLRYPVSAPAVLSSAPGQEVAVTITDISEEGCQLARGSDIEPSSWIILSFGGYAPVEAAVVWTSPAAFGLRFDAPLHAALVAQIVSAGRGRRRVRKLSPGLIRREEREKLWHLALPVSLTVVLETGGNEQLLEGELCDLSVEGCRVNTPIAISPGTEVLVSIAGKDPISGVTRWYRDNGVGISFHDPLLPQVLQRLATLPAKRPY